MQATRTERDFAQHLRRTVATDPQAQWIFIADQLNTHPSESLVRWVAEQEGGHNRLGDQVKDRDFALNGDAQGVFVRSGSSHSVSLYAEACLLAESN